MITKTKIKYVSGLCGSGKTHTITNYIASWSSRKHLIIVPTIELSKQYARAFVELEHSCFVINSNNSTNVLADVVAAIKQINTSGYGTLVVTLETAKHIPVHLMQGKNRNWFIFNDEIPTIDTFFDPTIPYNQHILSDLIKINDIVGCPHLYEAELKDSDSFHKAESICKRNDDQVDNIIKPILQGLIDFDRVLIDKNQWDKVVLDRKISNDKDEDDLTYGNKGNKLYFLILKSPRFLTDLSDNITILGANFENSLLKSYWERFCNIDFEEDAYLKQKLRYSAHDNGHLLKIIYLSEKNTSKSNLNKMIENTEISVAETFIKTAEGYFDNTRDVLAFVNNDMKDTITNGWDTAPIISHGLNKWDTYTQVYFSAALNRAPKHLKMLRDCGFSSDFVTKASAHEILYQGIMRTALRRPDNKEIVTAVVSDKAMGIHLAELFNGCEIGESLNCMRKVIAKTPKEMKNKHRMKDLINENALLNRLLIRPDNEKYVVKSIIKPFASTLSAFSIYNIKEHGQNGRKNFQDNTFPIEGSYFQDIYKTNVNEFESLDAMSFINEMKKFATNNILDNKEQNYLMNAVVYTTRDARKQDNVFYNTAIILDIDEDKDKGQICDLSPELCHEILEKYKIPHIMTNSASRRIDNEGLANEVKYLNRYRVFIFVQEVMTPEVSKEIYQYVMDLFKSEGYYTIPLGNKEKYLEQLHKNVKEPKFTGLDMSKIGLHSIFYMPCQIRGREKWAFFWKSKYCRNSETLVRYALKPSKILKHYVQEPKKYELVFEQKPVEEKPIVENKLMKVILDKINELSSGDRSYKTTIIGGLSSNLSHDEKIEVLERLRSVGVDSAALKSFKKYAKL